MVGINRPNWRREPRPGFRWQAFSVPGPRPGSFTTQHREVPIVGPETTSQVLAGMGGQEDRLGALAGADRVPPQDVTTVIKEYADETPNTKTTTIKGGLLGDPAQDWAGRGAERDERGMQDWYAHMAQAQARRQQGTAAPDEAQARAALTDAAKQSWDYSMFGLPQTIAKKIVGQPSAPSVYPHQMGITPPSRPPLPPVQGDFPGRGAERDERGMRDWYAQMAQAQARQQQGTAAPSQQEVQAALGGYGDIRRSQFTPPPIETPSPQRARTRLPPGPVQPPQVDVGQGDFPGRTAEFDERGMQDWNAQMAQLRNRQQTGGAAPTQAQVEESLGRYGDFRRRQLTPPPSIYPNQRGITPPVRQPDPDSIATGPTDAMIEERFRRETAMIPDNERFVGGDVPSVSGIGTRVDQQLPREIGGEGDVGRIDVRKRGQQLPREVTESASGFPTGKDSKANDQVEMNNNPNLEKIWGKYAYDPKARRKFYLDNLKDIWRKALLMDVVANLTGGQSMSKRYLEMATGRLDAMEKFNEEDRISNIWKDVFTDANGNFYMPKNKREAAERAAKTGARPAVIKDIFGSVPDVKKKAQYHRVDPNDPTKWENKRFDPDEEPSEEWITGASRTTSPDTEDIYTGRLKEWDRLRGTNPELARAYGRMIGAVQKDPKGVSPSRWTSILQGDIQGSDPTIQLPEGVTATSFIMKWLTNPEVEYVDPISGDPKKMPGYTALTGQKATKEEIAEATGATTATTPEYASRAEAKSAIIAENPKPEGMSDEVYNRKIEEKVREIYGE